MKVDKFNVGERNESKFWVQGVAVREGLCRRPFRGSKWMTGVNGALVTVTVLKFVTLPHDFQRWKQPQARICSAVN